MNKTTLLDSGQRGDLKGRLTITHNPRAKSVQIKYEMDDGSGKHITIGKTDIPLIIAILQEAHRRNLNE